MGWYGDGTGMGWGWGWGWGWVFGLLVIAGLVLLVVVLVRVVGGGVHKTGRPSAQGRGSSAAEKFLAERYARGEIDTAEYTERLRHLRGD